MKVTIKMAPSEYQEMNKKMVDHADDSLDSQEILGPYVEIESPDPNAMVDDFFNVLEEYGIFITPLEE